MQRSASKSDLDNTAMAPHGGPPRETRNVEKKGRLDLVLVVQSGGCKGKRATYRQSKVRVGRRSSNDLALDTVADKSVSGHHVEFFREDGQWWARDLQSTNGTSLNGRPMKRRFKLNKNDVIGLGCSGQAGTVTLKVGLVEREQEDTQLRNEEPPKEAKARPAKAVEAAPEQAGTSAPESPSPAAPASPKPAAPMSSLDSFRAAIERQAKLSVQLEVCLAELAEQALEDEEISIEKAHGGLVLLASLAGQERERDELGLVEQELATHGERARARLSEFESAIPQVERALDEAVEARSLVEADALRAQAQKQQHDLATISQVKALLQPAAALLREPGDPLTELPWHLWTETLEKGAARIRAEQERLEELSALADEKQQQLEERSLEVEGKRQALEEARDRLAASQAELARDLEASSQSLEELRRRATEWHEERRSFLAEFARHALADPQHPVARFPGLRRAAALEAERVGLQATIETLQVRISEGIGK